MIPKILHYCFGFSSDFGGKPWSLVHYACVKSAVERIKPDRVYFWCEYTPEGPWWELTRGMVEVMRIKAPREIFGNPLLHVAHRADVVRLEKLIEHGGIYLDTDVFVHRDVEDLLQHSVVMGQEGDQREFGLCNAVILAEPGAPFLRRWHGEFKSFRSKGDDEFWAEYAVSVPMRLAKEFPNEVTVLPPAAFFWPLWTPQGIERIFNSTEPIPRAGVYVNHLWEKAAWENYLRDLTPGRVRRTDSNFHFWVRPLLAGLPDHYGAPASAGRAAVALKRTAGRAANPRRAAALLWHAANRTVSSLFPESGLARLYRRRTFRNIYDRKLWGWEKGRTYYSGVGSSGEPVKVYLDALAPIIAEVAKKIGDKTTVVDLGCGDFRVGSELLKRLPFAHYIGCDIVPGLIAENTRQYANERITFRRLDMVSEALPAGHIFLVRQVLQHLPNRDVARVLAKLRAYPNVYVTEAQPEIIEGPVNPDVPAGSGVRFNWQTGRGRGVELDQPPFNVPVEEICRVSPGGDYSHEIIVTYRLNFPAAAGTPDGPNGDSFGGEIGKSRTASGGA
ncbi:MAG TPA: glycosyltransferase [Terriglobia bacterium]|nr:glycosyltransferase [Terriglobia bacterium]